MREQGKVDWERGRGDGPLQHVSIVSEYISIWI